jgi:hypothetical protein
VYAVCLYDHDHDDENDREQAFVQYQYSHTILYLRNWASNGNEMHLVAMAMGSILYTVVQIIYTTASEAGPSRLVTCRLQRLRRREA